MHHSLSDTKFSLRTFYKKMVLQIQEYKDGDSEINLEFHLFIDKILSPQSLGNTEREKREQQH